MPFRWALAFCACTLTLPAAVTRVHLEERRDVLDGRAFGAAGPYERVTARVYFEIDPALPQNKAIRDLLLAPRNARGMVEFSAAVYVLRPRDVTLGNGTFLLEIPNRGGKGMLSRFMYARPSLDPQTREEFGDLSLLEKGYSLAWIGWQWDVPEKPGLLRLDAPAATKAEGPVTGPVRAEFIPDRPATVLPLGDRSHLPYKPVEAALNTATVAVRVSPDTKPRFLPRSSWRWSADRTAIEIPSGMEPGRMYEAVYTAQDPPVVGLGLAAVRDFVSYIRNQGSGTQLLGDMKGRIKRTLGFGISQSGRFLRTFLYFGFNEDEQGRKVFDGIWADVAGAGRGSFNHRFAQASRDGYPYFNVYYATDLFPFADEVLSDPFTGVSDGLLARVKPEVMPRIVYTNNSSEYWSRAAALVHLSPDGKRDLTPPPNVRIYCWSGTQHYPGAFAASRPNLMYPPNPTDQRPYHRAVLAALEEWVREGKAPPPSRYPLLEKGELVSPSAVKLPLWAGVSLPKRARLARQLDFGPDFTAQGIVTKEPPVIGASYPQLVPRPDADGLDLGGYRLPLLAAPLGLFTGWNPRSPGIGTPGELSSLDGLFLPLPKEEILRRYTSREAWLRLIEAETDRQIQERLILPADRAHVLNHAARLWDFVLGKP